MPYDYYRKPVNPLPNQGREEKHNELMATAEAAWAAAEDVKDHLRSRINLGRGANSGDHDKIMKKLDSMDERLARLERAAGVLEQPAEASGHDPA